MLSEDLKMLSQQLSQRVDANGELHLSETTVRLVEFVLADAHRIAKQLEANVVRQPAVLIDLSDPKIELFPKPKRPAVIPIRSPDDGGAA